MGTQAKDLKLTLTTWMFHDSNKTIITEHMAFSCLFLYCLQEYLQLSNPFIYIKRCQHLYRYFKTSASIKTQTLV